MMEPCQFADKINEMHGEYQCIDCGKSIKWKHTKRCKECAYEQHAIKMQGMNNPNWKGGIGFCNICGKKMPDRRREKCLSCGHRGTSNPNWRGGISSLTSLIRGLSEYINWRNKIFERDKFTCRECSQLGHGLHAHHIKPFKDIFQEFLVVYSQFSPLEDKETLLRLALNYSSFWDISNGLTLCNKCHGRKRNGKRIEQRV